MSRGPFTPATLRWLLAVAVFSFVGGLALAVFGPELERVPSRGADSFSPSALGHSAFVELLRELDVPVVSSRHASRQRAGRAGVLVVAEPQDCPPGSPRAAALRAMLVSTPRAMLVLPKWRGRPHPSRDGWIGSLELRPRRAAENALQALGADLVVRRAPLATLGSWHTRSIGHAPSFPLPTVQLLAGAELRPLVSCPQGVLLGEWKDAGGRMLILSDPDVLSNGGLGLGANAALVVAAIESLRPRGAAVVVDETIHGHERVPSIWRELFSFPLVLLMAHAVLVTLVVLWTATGRFGAPARPAPAVEPGRGFLIENTADLLRYRGHTATAVNDYLRNAVRDVRRAVKAPPHLRGKELEAWLDRVGAARGARDRLGELRIQTRSTTEGSARAAPALAAATRIHRWRQEILHGPSGHPDDS